MSEKIVLEVNKLNTGFITDKKEVPIIKDVSFKLEKGKVLALVGESGCGKSVTVNSIMRTLPKNSRMSAESIIYRDYSQGDDDNAAEYHIEQMGNNDEQIRKLRGTHIAMIFQDPMVSLNPVYKVGDQIIEGLLEHNPKMKKADAKAKAVEMLKTLNIPAAEERINDYPHQFSGGMKQRIIIAIALACEPNLLIADEPTTALDVTIQAQVLDMMRALREKYKMSMLMITHDLGIVAEMCDTVSVIYAGRVVEHGSLRDVFKHTLHPYTEGLFNSLPDMDNPKAELKPIPGLMPDPTERPAGCPFAPRCKYASEICTQEKPIRLYANEEHYVECHLYDKESVVKGGLLER